jgi:hypothetical protein
MKTASSALLAAAALLAPALAAAQPSQSPPPGPPPPPPPGQGYYSAPPATAPGGFMDRRGLAFGFGFGIGGMSAEEGDIECPSCDYNPLAGAFDFHIGGMLSPRLALLLEVQGSAQTIDEDYYGTETLSQVALMGAAQFWLTPRLWLKGGLGVASLDTTYSDDYSDEGANIDTGGAVLLAAGVELLQRRDFAIDLQGRVLVGSYEAIDDTITSGTIGVGFNWY